MSLIPPPILTERLEIKCRAMSDLQPMAAILNDPKLAYHLSQVPHPYAIEAAESDLKRITDRPISERNLNRHIWLKDSQTLIGAVMVLWQEKFDGLELGYWLGSDYWGQGYISEALTAFIPFAFKHIESDILFASVAKDNKKSMAVLEKFGFARQGEMLVEDIQRGQRPSYYYTLHRN